MSAALTTWVLATARLTAILWVQVLWRRAVPAWSLLALGLSMTLATLVPVAEPEPLGELVVLGAFEVLLGLVIGLLVTLPGHALLGAMGASALVLRTPVKPLARLCVSLTLASALGLGLHRPLLGTLLETFVVLPLAEPTQWIEHWVASGAGPLVRAAHAMLVLALALATPVLLMAAVADLATRSIGRGPGPVAAVVAPLEVWLRAAGGIVALGASWAAYSHVWAESVGIVPP